MNDTVFIIGHKNPDLDSITSSIVLGYYKKLKGVNWISTRSGKIDEETRFVLDKFGFNVPELIKDISGKKVCLVDHCAISQSVNGLKDAEIIRQNFKDKLLNRKIDDEGYVSTHQHYGMGHPDGWPFPLWFQIRGMGWHFRSMNGLLRSWGTPITENTNDWIIEGAEKVKVDNLDGGLFIKFKKKDGYIISTKFPHVVKGISAPLIRIEWQAKGIPKDAKPYIEWTTEKEPEFSLAP